MKTLTELYDDFVLKLKFLGEGEASQTRRVKLTRIIKDNLISYEELVAIVISMEFPEQYSPNPGDFHVRLTYQDVDKDTITIRSSEELLDATNQFIGQSVLMINAQVKQMANTVTPTQHPLSPPHSATTTSYGSKTNHVSTAKSNKLAGNKRQWNRGMCTFCARGNSTAWHSSIHVSTAWHSSKHGAGYMTPRQHPNCQCNFGYNKPIRINDIKALEEEAKKLLIGKEYKNAVSMYSSSITFFSGHTPNENLAVLLLGRAQQYLSIRAAEGAILDCTNAMKHVSSAGQPLVLDVYSGPILQARIHIQMARALCMAGNAHRAMLNFKAAVANTENLLAKFSTGLTLETKAKLLEIMTDGVSGMQEVSQLQDAIDKLSRIKLPSLQPGKPHLDDCKLFHEALALVSTALLKAPCSTSLHEKKIALLVSLGRWHEVASHCERLAVGTLLIQGISHADIDARKIFWALPPVKTLDILFFGDPKEEDFILHNMKEAQTRLPSKQAAEALLRLPKTLMRSYLRSLRLEERYEAEQRAITALQAFLKDSPVVWNGQAGVAWLSVWHDQAEFTWLSEEKDKLTITTRCRDKGNQLYKEGKFKYAAVQYTECLKVDCKGELVGLECDGGRLHAILYLNRGACFMALGKYKEALNDFSSALQIHNCYMKAILCRARCFRHMDRLGDATAEYQKYLDLCNKSMMAPPNSYDVALRQCIFGGPETLTNEDILRVEHERHAKCHKVFPTGGS